MTYVGSLIGNDSAAGNLKNLTTQWADLGAFAAGDLALTFWEHVQGAGGGDPPSEVTDPTGFTLEGFVNDGGCTLSVWSKVLTGSESGNITGGHAGATRHCLGTIVVRGYAGVHAVAGTADAGTDGVHTTPAATPSIADVGVIIASGERQNTGSTSATYPGGYTQALVASTVSTPGGFLSVAYEGSAGSISGTHSVSVSINPGNITHNVSVANAPTLTVLLVPNAVTGAAALSGSGALTGSGTPRAASTPALSGSGTLTAAGMATAPAALSGSGMLTAVGIPALARAAALSGSGTLAALGSVPALGSSYVIVGGVRKAATFYVIRSGIRRPPSAYVVRSGARVPV